MAQQAQATRNTITIKGSTKIVTEFFAYAVNRRACAAAAARPAPPTDRALAPRLQDGQCRRLFVSLGGARAQRPVPARRVPARHVRAAEALRADDDGDHRPGRRAVPEQRAAADVRRAGRACFHWQERAGLSASEARAAGADWLLEGQLQKMVLVVTSIASQEVLERWAFDIQTSRAPAGGGRAAPHGSAHAGGRLLRGATVIALAARPAPTLRVGAAARPPPEKPESEITSEIQAIIRQARFAGPARRGRPRAHAAGPRADAAGPRAHAAGRRRHGAAAPGAPCHARADHGQRHLPAAAAGRVHVRPAGLRGQRLARARGVVRAPGRRAAGLWGATPPRRGRLRARVRTDSRPPSCQHVPPCLLTRASGQVSVPPFPGLLSTQSLPR